MTDEQVRLRHDLIERLVQFLRDPHELVLLALPVLLFHRPEGAESQYLFPLFPHNTLFIMREKGDSLIVLKWCRVGGDEAAPPLSSCKVETEWPLLSPLTAEAGSVDSEDAFAQVPSVTPIFAARLVDRVLAAFTMSLDVFIGEVLGDAPVHDRRIVMAPSEAPILNSSTLSLQAHGRIRDDFLSVRKGIARALRSLPDETVLGGGGDDNETFH